MQTNNEMNYSLYAQNRDDILIIKNHKLDNYVRLKASEILANSDLTNGLPPEDIKIITFIAQSQVKGR